MVFLNLCRVAALTLGRRDVSTVTAAHVSVQAPLASILETTRRLLFVGGLDDDD